MLNLNRVEVIGNLTRDPELRFTQSNQAVASFSIATNRRYKDQTGNWVDAPAEYHDVSVWGQLGERSTQLLHKGDRIFVFGRLQTRSWDAQDGTKRYKTEIVADGIFGPDQLNKSTGQSGEGSPASGNTNHDFSPSPKQQPSGNAPEEINIDDIPF